MNAIDEWLNSDAAKRDALKFKNGCYIISGMRCGKTKMMNDLFERLKDQKVPNIRYLRQKFDDVDATNAIKEFINKQYGANSFGRAVPDDSLDVLRYILPTVEQIRKEKNMTLLQKGNVMAKHRYSIGYSYGATDAVWCESYINDDKDIEFVFEYLDTPFDDKAKITVIIERNIFEKEVLDKEVWAPNRYDYIIGRVRDASSYNLLIVSKVVTSNFFLAVTRGYNNWLMTQRRDDMKELYNGLRGKFIKPNILDDVCYCITDYYLDPRYQGDEKRTRARLHAYKKPANITMETWGIITKRYSKEYIKERYMVDESTLVYYVYDDGRIEIPCYEFVEDIDYPNKAKLITDRINPDTMDISKEMEMLKNYKKEEETKKMDINVIKGSFNSKLYMIKNGSEDLSYLGTVMGMSIDRALGCELVGKIDFIADDEPVKKLQYFNREFIKNVVFNDPATIVEWKDGTKTVVQARDGEKFDPEKGLAMAIAKKAMGNKRDYYHVFKHYLKKVEKTSKKKDLKEIIKSMPDELYYNNQAVDLKDFKEDVENDLVTFKCSKADAERIRGFITRSDESSNDVRIIPETIEEVKRYEESEKISDVDAEGPLMPL